MKTKLYLYFTMFCLWITPQTQANIVEIEEDDKAFSSCSRFLPKTNAQKITQRTFTKYYMECFNENILFEINFKNNKPKSIFINDCLLNNIDDSYYHDFISSIKNENKRAYLDTSYFKQSFEKIKEYMLLSIIQLRLISMRKVITFHEFEKLMNTFSLIDSNLDRAKTEFKLTSSKYRYFVKQF